MGSQKPFQHKECANPECKNSLENRKSAKAKYCSSYCRNRSSYMKSSVQNINWDRENVLLLVRCASAHLRIAKTETRNSLKKVDVSKCNVSTLFTVLNCTARAGSSSFTMSDFEAISNASLPLVESLYSDWYDSVFLIEEKPSILAAKRKKLLEEIEANDYSKSRKNGKWFQKLLVGKQVRRSTRLTKKIFFEAQILTYDEGDQEIVMTRGVSPKLMSEKLLDLYDRFHIDNKSVLTKVSRSEFKLCLSGKCYFLNMLDQHHLEKLMIKDYSSDSDLKELSPLKITIRNRSQKHPRRVDFLNPTGDLTDSNLHPDIAIDIENSSHIAFKTELLMSGKRLSGLTVATNNPDQLKEKIEIVSSYVDLCSRRDYKLSEFSFHKPGFRNTLGARSNYSVLILPKTEVVFIFDKVEPASFSNPLKNRRVVIVKNEDINPTYFSPDSDSGTSSGKISKGADVTSNELSVPKLSEKARIEAADDLTDFRHSLREEIVPFLKDQIVSSTLITGKQITAHSNKESIYFGILVERHCQAQRSFFRNISKKFAHIDVVNEILIDPVFQEECVTICHDLHSEWYRSEFLNSEVTHVDFEDKKLSYFNPDSDKYVSELVPPVIDLELSENEEEIERIRYEKELQKARDISFGGWFFLFCFVLYVLYQYYVKK